MNFKPDADNASELALQDYFDDLLGDTVADAGARALDSTPKLAVGSNIAALPTVLRTSRQSFPRPYAEPIRTLNLRMPLPPVAPPAIEVATAAPVAVVPAEIVPAEVAQTSAEPLVAASLPALEVARVLAPAPTPPPIHAEVAVEIAAAEPVEAVSEHAMAAPQDWLPNGRPQWAQQPFECLLFKAGGLTLAVPLAHLGSIYPLEEDSLTPIFGQSGWFIGLLPTQQYNARVIDTAQIVMPERHAQTMREGYRYVITLFGSDWGLAVDAVVNSVTLDPEQVRWRGQRSQRPWLAGTVVEHMCALLDTAQLAWMLHNQDRKRRVLPD